MPETRRRYDRDFREGAVEIARETGKPIAQVAPDLGINWARTCHGAHDADTSGPAGFVGRCRGWS